MMQGKRISRSFIMMISGAIIMYLLSYTPTETIRPRIIPCHKGTHEVPEPDVASTNITTKKFPYRKVHFYSFASTEFARALKRIAKEANETGAFHAIHTFTPEDIPSSYYASHGDVLNQTRGKGYWLWKPYFLNHILQTMKTGDIIMYADSGCEFVSSPQPYIDLADRYGFVGFRLPGPQHMVHRWTKGDIFDAVGLDMETYGYERQHMATIWLLQKQPRIERFARDWLQFSENAQLITDAPSFSPNHPDFQENRHDQAIYSLLVYKYRLEIVLEDRTYPRSFAPIISTSRRRD